MAKPLVFEFQGIPWPFQMEKVDRARLYGYKEMETVDEQERPCELATLGDDGQTVVGRGGTGIGYLSAAGLWCDKTELTPIDVEGRPIQPVPSSFASPIRLSEPTTVDDYFEHNIRAVYVMNLTAPPADAAGLLGALDAGSIFAFPYSFRGGLQADAGFLLKGNDGNIYFAVGSRCRAEFVGIQQLAGSVEQEEAPEEEEDAMDFEMM